MWLTRPSQTMQEAESSTRRLCLLVEEVVRSNSELADRIRGLEREGSVIAKSTAVGDEVSTICPNRNAEAVSYIDTSESALQFTFEHDLQASHVYNRTINRHSLASFTSTALYTTALSVFSNLSLSQVSNISFYALPVYALDLSNSSCYIFGQEGALQNVQSPPLSLTATASDDAQRKSSKPRPETVELQLQTQTPTRLLGRFARRSKISRPINPVHVVHVGYNQITSQFTV